MYRLGFGIEWKGWIMECLLIVRISILVNESPIEEFKVGKGLRQGDLLSPFLFLMIGKGFTWIGLESSVGGHVSRYRDWQEGISSIFTSICR